MDSDVQMFRVRWKKSLSTERTHIKDRQTKCSIKNSSSSFFRLFFVQIFLHQKCFTAPSHGDVNIDDESSIERESAVLKLFTNYFFWFVILSQVFELLWSATTI